MPPSQSHKLTEKSNLRDSEQIPIGARGTVRAVEFKKVKVDDEDPGLKIYDPGYNLKTLM